VKAALLTSLAASLVATTVGCGLDLAGEASPDPREAGLLDDGFVPPGSSGGSTDGSAGNPFDHGFSADGPREDSTTAAPGSPIPDAAIGDRDAGDVTTFPEAGPSHGTMGCPPSSDAGLCDLSSNVCCTCPGCFAPFPTLCLPALTGCVGVVLSGVYARLTCGDSTNCATGSVCCAGFDMTSALVGSSCLASCPTTGAAQLCTTSAECAAGKMCQPSTAISGFSTCQ
jgi:hypothetical protein